MTYLGSFGFHDEERADIKQTVQLIRYGMISGDVPAQEREEQVFVRLVSGDHEQACKRVAIQSGIVTSAQADDPDVCMSGEQFVQSVGGYQKTWNE